jgi:hypothetical protein
MAMDTNVRAVKPVMEIAVVTMKIDALLDLPVPQAQPAWTENTVPKEGKARLELKVPVKDTAIHRHLLDASNVLLDPKETTVHPDPLELQDPKDNRVHEVAMDTQVPALLAQLAMPALPVPTVIQAPEVITVPMPKLEAKALPVVKVKTAAPVPLAPKETMVPLVILANLALKVPPARLVVLAIRLAKVNLVQLVNLAVPAWMPNIVHALTVPKLKPDSPHHPTFELKSVTRDIFLRFSILVLFTAKFSII